MRIGIIGPGEVEKYCKRANISKNKYHAIVKGLAESVARTDHHIIVTPDKGSTTEMFAKEYKLAGGHHVDVIVPLDDKEFGYKHVNTDLADKQINCGTWRNQPESMCEQSDLLVCIGWGGGTLAEMYYTRWFGNAKGIYVINDLIDTELPKSLNENFTNNNFNGLEYIPASKLGSKLK